MTGVLVLAALPEEVGPTRARLRRRARLRGTPNIQGWTGTLAQVPVTLALTGAGAANARTAMTRLLSDRPTPALVVVIGLGGGLDPRLRAADLVIGAHVMNGDGASRRVAHAQWLARAERATGGVPGTIATVDQLVGTAAEKRVLVRRLCTQLDAEGLPWGAVDLETWWCVEQAAEQGIPWVALRAISDAAQDDLPAPLSTCRDAQGGIDRRRVVLGAVRQPGSVPGLVRLAWRTRRCAQVLADALERLIASRPSLLPLGRVGRLP